MALDFFKHHKRTAGPVVCPLPKYRTAKQLIADGTFPAPVSQATVLKHAKAHGIGKKVGRVILFNNADVDALYEAFPCPSKSSKGPKAPTGICAALSADKALKKAQALLTKSSPKKSGPKGKPKS